MTVPGDKPLTTAEIVRLIDIASADVHPGWVPSDHFEEDSLVSAYYQQQEQEGGNSLYKAITTNPFLARLIMAGKVCIDEYESDNNRTIAESIVGLIESSNIDDGEVLVSFLRMRAEIIAEQVKDWQHTESQLGMFQLDGFLIGFLMGKQSRDG